MSPQTSRTKLLRILVSLCAVLLASACEASAQAVTVSCGETITHDTTLANDLTACPNNGLVIGADDITLDLNGHRVAGDGKPFKSCGKDDFCDIGLLYDGHDGVSIKHGSVREFGIGVFVARGHQDRVLRVSSSRNTLFGFVVANSADILVRDSSGNDNLAPEGDGIGLFGSRRVRILESSFRRNAQLGMHVVDSAANLIKGNVISRNTDMGILMEGDRNQVRHNRCVRNGTCIIVGPGSRNVIAWNRVARGREGIAIEKGRGNVIAHNVVLRTGAKGIRLGLDDPPIGGTNNLVRGNLVRSSGADGFEVTENDHRSLLIGNIAIGTGDDGFDIRGLTTRLVRNRGRGNADLGIEADLGVADGGGNRAGGNGNPLQCTNVFCS
jgi:parallel beta-helix repeat protein